MLVTSGLLFLQELEFYYAETTRSSFKKAQLYLLIGYTLNRSSVPDKASRKRCYLA